MRNQANTIGLPRRVSAYYLLFALAAIAWLGFGVFHVSRVLTREKSDSTTLSALGRFCRSMELEFLRRGDANFQPLVERARNRSDFAYLAVVSPSGEYLAHSSPELVGTAANEPAGAAESWGDVQLVRFVNDESIVIKEYHAPLRASERFIGTVRMAIVEPDSLRSLLRASRFAPAVIAGPLVFMALGVFVLGKLTRPVEDIERQLRVAATSSSVAGCSFSEVATTGPAAVGWNRLIDERSSNTGDGRIADRLSKSLGSLRARHLESILNGLADGVARTDGAGLVTYSNATASALVGTQLEPRSDDPDSATDAAAQATSLLDLLSNRWRVAEKPELLDGKSARRTVVVELAHASDKENKVLRVSRAPFQAADGDAPEGHLWTFRDVTQQKLADEMRNQFVDTATHELRTPLANIKAYAETLALSEVTDVEQQKEFLNTINLEATRLARFVDDLLSVSSMEVGSLTLSKQTTDVERLLTEVVDKTRAQMDEKDITFDAVFSDKLPEAALDKDKIAATLVNLLGNASKYTPNGGKVVLRASATNDSLDISIEDSGFGISKEELPKLFDKFFRSEDARVRQVTGTGLGLSLANEVVRLHGGAITVESELGVGSTFTVSLPLTYTKP